VIPFRKDIVNPPDENETEDTRKLFGGQFRVVIIQENGPLAPALEN